MYPEIISLGPFVLKTINVFYILAFIYTAFLLWRKSREEHYREDLVIDGYLLSSMVGLICARVAFILLHWDQYGFQVTRWFDVFAQAGGVMVVGVLTAGIYLYYFAKAKKWDAFELLDFWSIALTAGLAVVSLGMLFDGAGLGITTTLPWGVQIEGVFEKLHPVPIYWAIIYAVLSWYLYKTEYTYRTYRWYRSKRGAQTGFLTSVSLITVGACGLLLMPISMPSIQVGQVVLDWYVYGLVLAVGIGMLYVRSGRRLLFFSR